jgi:hypothetical protein
MAWFPPAVPALIAGVLAVEVFLGGSPVAAVDVDLQVCGYKMNTPSFVADLVPFTSPNHLRRRDLPPSSVVPPPSTPILVQQLLVLRIFFFSMQLLI